MTRRRRFNPDHAAATMRVNGTAPALIRPHFVGVDADDWTDLPPAQYPPDTVAFIGKALALPDRKIVNGYVCDGCQGLTLTRDRHPGYSPDVVDHKRFDPNSRCPGTARSLGYPDADLPAGWEPSHEWFRPSEDELLNLPDPFIHHVLKGGLILRPIPAAGQPTPEASR